MKPIIDTLSIDIREDYLLKKDDLLNFLLQDKTTDKNILCQLILMNKKVHSLLGLTSERFRRKFGNETALSFEIIAKNPGYTSQQIALEIGKSARTIEKYISSLKKA